MILNPQSEPNDEKRPCSAGGCATPEQIEGAIGWWEGQRERFAGFELVPHLFRLLAEGQPVSVDELARASSRPAPAIESALGRHPGVDRDDAGRIVGFGLTLRPTPHRFTFAGRSVYAFCASDALIFPIVLGRAGRIESACPATREPVLVDVTPSSIERVRPATAVVSLVRPEKVGDVRAEICALGHFFASESAAAEWLEAHPEGMVHSVEDDFKLHREIMLRLGWASPEPVSNIAGKDHP